MLTGVLASSFPFPFEHPTITPAHTVKTANIINIFLLIPYLFPGTAFPIFLYPLDVPTHKIVSSKYYIYLLYVTSTPKYLKTKKLSIAGKPFVSSPNYFLISFKTSAGISNSIIPIYIGATSPSLKQITTSLFWLI